MPLMRYKKHPEDVFHACQFNVHAMCEVLTGGDSAFCSELDVYLQATGEWKDFPQALRDKDIVPDNYHVWFAEPRTPEDRERGYIE